MDQHKPPSLNSEGYLKGDWEEHKHPRAEDGKFSSSVGDASQPYYGTKQHRILTEAGYRQSGKAGTIVEYTNPKTGHTLRHDFVSDTTYADNTDMAGRNIGSHVVANSPEGLESVANMERPNKISYGLGRSPEEELASLSPLKRSRVIRAADEVAHEFPKALVHVLDSGLIEMTVLSYSHNSQKAEEAKGLVNRALRRAVGVRPKDFFEVEAFSRNDSYKVTIYPK